jgi:hypothetical protein
MWLTPWIGQSPKYIIKDYALSIGTATPIKEFRNLALTRILAKKNTLLQA